MSNTIHKKVLPEYFEALLSGTKTFELRLADWECTEGDVLVLEEISSTTRQPTGCTITKRVGYVLHTKNLELFPKADVDEYGYQVISLLDENAA